MDKLKKITKTEQELADLIKEGQSGKYKHFVRAFTGRIRQMVQLKNPLDGGSMVCDIDTLFEIIDPKLEDEMEWFKRLQDAVKLWCNEKIIANRILGLKNDNECDMKVFEKVVMEKFYLSEKEKPKPNTVIQTDFKTMVELVEMGARRFS